MYKGMSAQTRLQYRSSSLVSVLSEEQQQVIYGRKPERMGKIAYTGSSRTTEKVKEPEQRPSQSNVGLSAKEVNKEEKIER